MIVARDTSASKNRVRSAKEVWELELLCLLMTPQIPLVQIGQPAPWRDKLIGGRDMFSLQRGGFRIFSLIPQNYFWVIMSKTTKSTKSKKA